MDLGDGQSFSDRNGCGGTLSQDSWYDDSVPRPNTANPNSTSFPSEVAVDANDGSSYPCGESMIEGTLNSDVGFLEARQLAAIASSSSSPLRSQAVGTLIPQHTNIPVHEVRLGAFFPPHA